MKRRHPTGIRLPAAVALLLVCSCPPMPDFKDPYVWSFYSGDPLVSSPVTDPEGNPIVVSFEGRLFCVNRDTGAVSWSIELNDSFTNPPVLDSDGAVYAGSGTGRLYKVTIVEGRAVLAWSYLPPSRTTEEPMLLGTATALIPNGVYQEGVLIDKLTGSEIARIPLPATTEAADPAFAYNTAFSMLFSVASPVYSYALSRGDGVFFLLREDGSVAATLDLPCETFGEGEYMIAENVGDPGPRIFNLGAFTAGAELNALGFRQYWDAETQMAKNRLLRLALGVSGISVIAELEDPEYEYELWGPTEIALMDGNVLCGYYYDFFILWDASTGALLDMKYPLAETGNGGWSSSIIKTYYGSSGKIALWYGKQSENNLFVRNRYLYVHDPSIPDAGRLPAVSIPAMPILANPSLSGDLLFVCCTKGRLQAYHVEGWEE